MSNLTMRFSEIYHNATLKIVIEYKDPTGLSPPSKYEISCSIIKKAKRDGLDSPFQFSVLTDYLNFKNKELKYLEIIDDIYNSLDVHDLVELAEKTADLMDIQELKKYITIRNDIIPNTFPASSNNHEDYKKDQTYSRDEYIELLAYSVYTKSMLPIISQMINIDGFVVLKDLLDYWAVKKVKHLFTIGVAYEKFMKFILEVKKEIPIDDVVMKKMIPDIEIPFWLFSSCLVKKIAAFNMHRDNNLVKICFKFIPNKLKPGSTVAGTIRSKTGKTNEEDGETESIIESYRTVTTITFAKVEELRWAVSDVDTYLDLFKLHNDVDTINNVSETMAIFLSEDIPTPNIILCSYFLPEIVYPEGIYHLQREQIILILTMTFVYLFKNGFEDIALLLSCKYRKEDAYMRVSNSTSKARLSKGDIDAINQIYPHYRTTETSEPVNPVLNAINELGNMYLKERLIYTADKKYLQGKNKFTETPGDIKRQLTKLIVWLNENLYKETL